MQGSSKKKLAQTLDPKGLSNIQCKGSLQQQQSSLHPLQLLENSYLRPQTDLLPAKSCSMSMSAVDNKHTLSISSQKAIHSPSSSQANFQSAKNGNHLKINTQYSPPQIQSLSHASSQIQAFSPSAQALASQNSFQQWYLNGQMQQSISTKQNQKQYANSISSSLNPLLVSNLPSSPSEIGGVSLLAHQPPSSHQPKQCLSPVQGSISQPFLGQALQVQQPLSQVLSMGSGPSGQLKIVPSGVQVVQINNKQTEKLTEKSKSNACKIKNQENHSKSQSDNGIKLQFMNGSNTFKKGQSMTPQNIANKPQVKMFESAKRQNEQKCMDEDGTISENRRGLIQMKLQLEENSKLNNDNYDIEIVQSKGNQSKQISEQGGGEKFNQQPSEKQKNREKSSTLQKNQRNSQPPGFNCNASCSKSSLPSNNSTTVQNHQSKHKSPSISSNNNIQQKENNDLGSDKKFSLSKTLSMALQQYHSIFGTEPLSNNNQLHSQSLIKLTHSHHAAESNCINNLPVSYQMQQALLSKQSKHRKVASMSSPKLEKDAMFINCQKGSYSDTNKLFPQQTYGSNIQHVNISDQEQEKERNNIQSPIQQSAQQTQKISSQPYKTPCNLSLNNSSHNQEMKHEAQRNNNEQNKAKNTLSKITNSNSTLNPQTQNLSAKKVVNNQLAHILIQQQQQQQGKQFQQQGQDQHPQKAQKSLSLRAAEDINKQKTSEQNGKEVNHNNYNKNKGDHKNKIEKIPENDGEDEKIKDTESEYQKQERQILSENQKMSIKFDNLLKQQIDENSYSQIMQTFSQLIQSDIYFQPSLSKFKICLDSLMHDINSKMKNLRILAGKAQQLKKASETASQEKKQLQNKVSALSAENALLLSNSTNVPNSNQSKNNHCYAVHEQNSNNFDTNLICEDSNTHYQQGKQQQPQQQQLSQKQQHARNRSFDTPHIPKLKQAEKQTQTLKESEFIEQKQNQLISKEEVDQTENENVILREYVVEQEQKIAAYKDKEGRMIKLLLAIKKRGVDIDKIYENDVVQQQSNQNQQQNNSNEDDDEEDGEQQRENNVLPKFIDNIEGGTYDEFNHSQSLGYADQSIINDSDESSFNYIGRTQSESEDSIASSCSNRKKQNSNANSGRSKFEEEIKKKLRINLDELKKISAQQNEDAAPNQEQQQQQQQNGGEGKGNKQVLDQEYNIINQSQQQALVNSPNIFIEQEYQECNFAADKKTKQQAINSSQSEKISANQIKTVSPMQEYLFNPSVKLSEKELAEYISKSDFETHQKNNFQNQFESEEEEEEEGEDEEENDNDDENDDVQVHNIHHNNNNNHKQMKIHHDSQLANYQNHHFSNSKGNENQVHQTPFQNELMDKLGDLSLTWPDDTKPVVY